MGVFYAAQRARSTHWQHHTSTDGNTGIHRGASLQAEVRRRLTHQEDCLSGLGITHLSYEWTVETVA